TPCFLKVYTYHAHPFQRMFRQGRSFFECRNLLLFRELGLPSAKVLAWGKQRNFLGRITEEFIVTESVPAAVPLDTFVRKNGLTELQSARIARTVGLWLRKLHLINFYHKDLHWRNILIHKETSGLKLTFIDCPKGDFHSFGPTRRHWRLKDCATLDKYASILVSDRARAIFLKSYLNQGCDSSEFKTWVRRIEDLRTVRFDRRKGRTKVKPLDTPD
ncbi:MAG TPA: hypothetical protein DCX06_13085, partial [Opitutae bacterium]|nr:hypothetical protein [Opitutae bacterium]